ncbi:MAG: hypothetical protein HYX72_05725 [Acidobacteria bacterium]|nr:hypothetical protein [Acidobacteriota bacterium]
MTALLLAFLCGMAAVDGASAVVSGSVSIANHDGKKPNNSNTVVWLTPVPAPSAVDREALSQLAAQKFRLIQQRKRFEPHVIAVPVGAVVEFPNHDPFFHNVFSLFEGKRFDLGLYEAGTTHTVRFDRPGISYIFCNIHPEMSAVVVVLNTPYYAVSNRAGEVTISNVPAGRYMVGVWHEGSSQESLKEVAREITVSASGGSLGSIRLATSTDLLTPHKNKYGRDYDRPNPPGVLYDQR